MECGREGCQRVVAAKGLCASHYQSERMARVRAAARAIERTCAHCGLTFSGRSPRAKFCSATCKDAEHQQNREWKSRAKPRPIGRTCDECGASIDHMAVQCHYCNRNCARRHRERPHREGRNRDRRCVVCDTPLAPLGLRRKYCSQACLLMKARADRYGLEPRELYGLLNGHDQQCAICRTTEAGGMGGWHLDHDHTSGRVRGFLCHNCNVLLGHAKEDPAILRAAIRYLKT